LNTSVADPGCLSRILIFFVHSRSRISDPTTAPKEEGGQNFFVLPFFVAPNIINCK
jgi:hypothetical protein